MTARGPIRSSSRPPTTLPTDARHGEQDAEDAEFRRAPAEHAGAVDAAEGEQRHEAVLVDHVGEEEAGDRAVPPRLLHRPAKMGEGLAGSGPEPASRGRRVRREQEQRRDEHEEPGRRQGTDDAVALPAGRIEAEERVEAEIGLSRLRARGEEAEHQDERDEAAGVAHRPARAGQAAEALRRHEAEHHGIVERRRGLRGDGRDARSRRARPR